MAHITNCPDCESNNRKKNGFDRHNIRRYRCLDCGKTYAERKVRKI